jgi:hypothetical protein
MARTPLTPTSTHPRSDNSTALDVARAKHAEHEHAVAPLKAEIATLGHARPAGSDHHAGHAPHLDGRAARGAGGQAPCAAEARKAKDEARAS